VQEGAETERPDRRASKRFSIERKIRYRVLSRGHIDIAGSGTTVNMNSVGMLASTDQMLTPGWRVEVEVDGPFQIDDVVSPKLIVKGRIVRVENAVVPIAAVKISSHTFKTGPPRNIRIEPFS
jgi:hypothetical protein